ncbi:MAG: type III-B CRISPR module RAMP protein Cmr1 [Candidatus Aminicenantes bacterium]|nr:type III-B CRISPR module RAMP protein Cmr1 [Candidatus Aminicenantes bacterium]
MNEISFKCEVITPMFLHGADGKTPELRLPSIKGSLRFWWRAIHYNLANLKKEESQEFGGSDQEIGRSRLQMRVTHPRNLKTGNEISPLPHKKIKFKDPIKYIEPGETFTVILRSRDDIGNYSRLFQLVSLLGGVGKRSRRGFGSFRIIEIDEKGFSSDVKIESVFSLVDKISPKNFVLDKGKIIQKNPTVSPAYPYIKEIEIGRTHKSAEGLLRKIGETTHKKNPGGSVDSLGFARGQDRQASPVYVTITKDAAGDYYPIITTLNTVLKGSGTIDLNIQREFKDRILL